MSKSEKRKEKGIYYITHSGELLIWLIIIFLAVSISSTSFMVKNKTEKDYHIFLPDVDGLIIGSPVRMMGVEVGYVTNLKPVGNEIFVDFVFTNPDVFIPQGSSVTVEFSGMAGSKSLELYLPDENTYIDKTTPVLVDYPPKRLRDALVLLDDMYKKINTIIYTCSSFGKKIQPVEQELKNQSTLQKDLSEFVKYSDGMIDDYTKRESAIKKRIGLEGVRGGK